MGEIQKTNRGLQSPRKRVPAGENRKPGATQKPYNRARTQGGASAARAGAYRKKSNGPDWSMILALAVIGVILLGLIALIAIGIGSCASGCDSKTTQPTGKLQIYQSDTATPVPEQTATPAPEATNAPEAVVDPTAPAQNTQATTGGLRSATIRSIGDFVIHDVIFQSAQRLAETTSTEYPYNFAPMLNLIRDAMGNADYTVTNVDGSMGGKQYYKYGYSGYPQFNTPPYLLYALKDAGVDMLTLANNHMLDGWFDGMVATVNNVEQVGLNHVGANRTQEERNTPVIYEINGIKVGFMNYTVSLNSMDKAKGMDSRALAFGANATKNSDAFGDAKALRTAGAEVIVCYMHWGTEYEDVDADQKTLANALVQAGVDVIIGGHPHVVQCAKWLSGTNQFGKEQRTLCLFSLGNFLSDQRTQYRDGGILFDFTIQEQADGTFSIVSPGYLPTWVWRTGDEANGYSYQVVPIGQYLDQRPSGMSDADYTRMKASYQESVAAMSQGIGVILKQ